MANRVGKGKLLFLQKRLKKRYTAAVIHPDNKTINTMLSLIFNAIFYNFFLRLLIIVFYSANCQTLFLFEFISSIRRLTQRPNSLIVGRTGMRDKSLNLKNKQI